MLINYLKVNSGGRHENQGRQRDFWLPGMAGRKIERPDGGLSASQGPALACNRARRDWLRSVLHQLTSTVEGYRETPQM